MKRYTARVKAKICVDCASPDLATTRRCTPCNLKHRDARTAHTRKRIKQGLCLLGRIAHKAKPGRTLCEEHLLKLALYAQKRREENRKEQQNA